MSLPHSVDNAKQAQALVRKVRKAVAAHMRSALLFSLCINLLLLVSPIYMLQVYDRILTSGSYDTLIWVTIIAAFLLAIYAVAESARRRVFALAGEEIETLFRDRVFDAFVQSDSLIPKLSSDASSLQRLYSGIQGGLFGPFFDAPFAPLFLGLLFVVHPSLGIVGVCGAVLLIIAALIGQAMSRSDATEAEGVENEIRNFLGGVSRQRSAIVSMGMSGEVKSVYDAARRQANALNLGASKNDGIAAGVSRSLRQILQILILGLGGYLALNQQVSAGAIVAGSILMGRALGPVDQIVGGWRQLARTLSAWRELKTRAAPIADATPYIALPRPEPQLRLESLSIAPPGVQTPLIRSFSMDVPSQSIVSVLGGNGVGKTTLLQILSAAWPAPTGAVTLGSRDLHTWNSQDRGRYIGYMPQGVELLPGTVYQNISRFRSDVSDEDVFEAAWRAGAHTKILSFPDGYDTKIGPGGITVSAGQAQSIGLARAFFGDPVLLLLDEPTANLDLETAPVVINAITDVCRRGAVVVVSTHDVRLIRQSDLALVLKDGRAMMGPPSAILNVANANGQNGITPIAAKAGT